MRGTTKRLLVTTVMGIAMLGVAASVGIGQIGPSIPVFVRGFVVATVFPDAELGGPKRKEIYLPGAAVQLREHGSNTVVTSSVSDLSGRFTLKVRIPGVYRICGKAEGFVENCFDKLFRLAARSEYAGNLRLTVPRSSDTAAVFGKVRLKDGSRPRSLQPLTGLNAFALVEMRGPHGVQRAYVNNYGEYVIPAVPVRDAFLLRASVDGGRVDQQVDPRTGLNAGRAYAFDLELDNTSPKLAPIVPLDASGKRVELARPGSTITLLARAEDRDGDALRYRWLVAQGNGSLSATDQPRVDWKLPGTNGRYAVTLIVTDGKGGYADSYFSFTVSTGGVRFSGNVVDAAGAPVGGAQVEVNGRTVRASAVGRFQLEVPSSDRYVLNVRGPSFALNSQIYVEGVTDGTWILRRAERTTVDPRVPTRLQHKRSREDCPGPRSQRLPWDEGGFIAPGLIQWQDGTGNALSIAELARRDDKAVAEALNLFARIDLSLAWLAADVAGVKFEPRPFEQIPCGPGIGIEFPADALVDQNGNLPTGNVEVRLATVDLQSPQQMPGDFSSLDPSGNPKVMESFGAGSVEISAGNTRYNLKPGATARVTIPVDRGQLVAGSPLPPTIPLLYYDERRGLWVEEGELKLVGTGIARAYEAEIKHLSSLNADLQKSGQSCVAVRSGPGLPATYTVEVTLPPFSAGAAPIVRSFPIDNSTGSEHVIYNLPNNKNIVLVPIVAGIKPDGSPGDVPAGVFVVNTGGPQTSAANPPPGPPYYNTDASGNPIGPCLTRVDLANLAIPSAPDAPYEFLQGLDVQSTNLTELTASDPALAAAIEAASTAYYTLIDQRGLRQDLIDFKDRNRFGQPLNTVNGELEVSAAYANSGDLGFGRSMHCRRSRASDGAFDIACYVTNYGDHTTPDADDAAAAAIQDATREVATVAMEYTRVENPLGDPIEFPDNSRTVKFYVYKKALASPTHAGQGNGRATSANLDGAGERPVPQLCVVCHGGVYASEPADPSNPGGLQKPAFAFRNDIFMQSRFIPFDLHFFTSPPAPNTVAAQQSAFRTLNLEIVRHVPEGALASDPVVELIDELYPGLAATQDDNAVVPNWDKATPASVDRKFYLDVFSRACRSCHITSPFGNVVMNNKNDFRALIANVQSRVCDQHVMPHAKRTHDLFWTSLGPNMAAQLQVYGQAIPGWDPTTPNAQCGLSYTPGGNVSVSTFTTEIQPIFTSRCTACHGTQAPFNANLALSAGNAYPNLFSGGVPVVSVEHPPTPRVRPGNSGDSYLYRKIEGTHPSLPPPFVAPGPGSQMPQGGPDLATVDNDGDGTNDREEIRVWIDVLGAPGP